jgi:hypothetical protein
MRRSGLRYYSLVTFPQSSYRKLASIDGRNDGRILFFDQVIPGSVLTAYANADHWAIALPFPLVRDNRQPLSRGRHELESPRRRHARFHMGT